MISEVFITCAVSESGTNVVARHGPAIQARRERMAVHIHVRDRESRRGSRDPALYQAFVALLRKSDVKSVINLIAGWAATPCWVDGNLPCRRTRGRARSSDSLAKTAAKLESR